MIDLNRQDLKRPVIKGEEDPPVFVQMLLMLPFVLMMVWGVLRGL